MIEPGHLMQLIRRPRVLLALAAVALAVGLTACGGDDGDGEDTVSAETYVDTVCSSFTELGSVIESGQADLEEALSGESSPEQGRDLLVGFLTDAATAAEAARSSIADAGVPDVDNGSEVADALNGALTDLQAAMDDARASAEDISTDSPAAFAADAQEIATAAQESSQQIGESLSTVGENEELDTAAEDAESCQQL